jgi:DNA-binding GntR family transcriptional regulator
VIRVHQPEAATARSLSDRAYYRIRELIVTLDLLPGSVVNERELMDRLQTGRTPVREALRRLAQERLVEVFPRRGILVSPVDVGDLGGLSEVRGQLEAFAAGLAAERASAHDRAELEALRDALERPEHDERTLMELDQRIHRHIHACAHNPFLEATLEEYYFLTLRIWFLALDRVARLEDAIGEHRELLDAILSGDADGAAEAMRRHVAGFERAIRAVL